jgi:eukaryotic-like serine/threonine-protein kinase
MAAADLAGRYRLEETLSTTTMAEVRAATDLDLGRRVVVKLLAPDADRPRFEREARAAAALAHANIVQLFDYGEESGRPYMVFEYLPGGSLEERLAEAGPLSEDEIARVATDLAGGLAHAHERGVVHRDLKPANVLFDAEGRAKIADLGIAQLRGADTLTDAGTVLGTAGYISPEQTRGEAATPASDVYAFGVVLYRLLSGRLPFEADSPAELAAMHREAEPPPLASIRRDVPAGLAALAMAALAKAQESRPPDGAALLRALTSHHSATDLGEADTVVMKPSRRRRIRPTPLGAALALVVIAAAGVLTAAVLTKQPARPPAIPIDTSPAARTDKTSTAEPTTTPASSTAASSTQATTAPTTAPVTTTTRSTSEDTTTAPTTSDDTTLDDTTTSSMTTPP